MVARMKSGESMKHWDEALQLARFVLEQHEQAIKHVELGDPVETARQLTLVQARCTELLEEVRTLQRTAFAPCAHERPVHLARNVVGAMRYEAYKEGTGTWEWTQWHIHQHSKAV
jgi:hypothetical protein